MSKVKSKLAVDKDNPQWTSADFKRAKPLSELVPPNIADQFKKHRGPQKEPKKVPISLRITPFVLEHFKAMGQGWQTKIDEELKLIVRKNALAKKSAASTPKRRTA